MDKYQQWFFFFFENIFEFRFNNGRIRYWNLSYLLHHIINTLNTC